MAEQHVSFQSPSSWEEYEEGLKIEGVAVTTGTFTGIDGHTINWTPEALDGVSETLLGTDITIGHNGHKAGAVTGKKLEEDRVLYRGIVWDPLAIKLIQEGKGTSIEANVTTTDEDPMKSLSANVSRIAIVNRPAAEGARVFQITPVELEKNEDEAGEKKDLEVSPSMDTQLEQLWPKVFKRLKDNDYSEEEAKKIIDILKKDISSTYPGSKSEDISGLFEEQNKKITETIEEALEEALEDLKVEEEPESGESTEMEAEIEKELNELREERDEWKSKFEGLTTELAEKKVESLISSIKEVDEEFDKETFLEDVEDLDVQATMLKRYLKNVERISESTETQLSVDEDTKEARLNKASQDIFGVDYADLDVTGEE